MLCIFILEPDSYLQKLQQCVLMHTCSTLTLTHLLRMMRCKIYYLHSICTVLAQVVGLFVAMIAYVCSVATDPAQKAIYNQVLEAPCMNTSMT